MTEEDLEHLQKYLNPAYLAGPSVSQVCERFAEDSHITLSKFLSTSFATRLRNAIRVSEASSATESVVPDHSSCLADGDWTIRGPPHRQRFLVPSGANSTTSTQLLDELRQLFLSPPFLKWLKSATTLVPAMAHVLPRRFRPGLDYTLATASEVPLLELEMSLTPSAGWDDGEVGGWECFMPSADDDTEADPAVYSAAKTSTAADGDDDDDEGQGGALLTTYPSWNQLVLVLRDPGVLTFTKYVSMRAGESRWDVRGQYTFVDDDGDE